MVICTQISSEKANYPHDIRDTSRTVSLTAFTPFTIIMYTSTEKVAVSKMRTELALRRAQVMKEQNCGGGTG